MAVIGEAEVRLRRRFMGGPGQRRYWLLNKRDGLLGLARATLAPRSLCGAPHPRMASRSCDRRRGHRGNHFDRRCTGACRSWLRSCGRDEAEGLGHDRGRHRSHRGADGGGRGAHYSRCRITDPQTGLVVYDGPAPAPPEWWDLHSDRLFSVEMLV